MKAIFYDRKNKCEVSAESLIHAKHEDGRDTFVEHFLAAEFLYKSPACPSHQNWDRYCNYSDLVFLRLE